MLEEEEEQREEDEEFYESLDRILSSSCSSTSCSDDESDHRLRIPRFPPPAATSYDAWTAPPASIEERRRRLLIHFGLNPPSRSRSNTNRSSVVDQQISRSVTRSVSDSEFSGTGNPVNSCEDSGNVELDVDTNEGTRTDVHVDEERKCVIKNLDNGEEFVVKEDGMWGRLRELTLEEFEMCVGKSPIVQELLRRQSVDSTGKNDEFSGQNGNLRVDGKMKTFKKKGGWLKSIKSIAGNVVAGGYYRERRNAEERDYWSSERGGRRSSSATDDSQDGSHQGVQRMKVRQNGKSFKEFNGLCLTQEIQSHTGSIWCIKFSLDGKYLASAGEDCVIHVWQISVVDKRGDFVVENGYSNPFSNNESPESAMTAAYVEGSHMEKKKRARLPNRKKSVSSDHLVVPDQIFALGEKPVCSFNGHLADVLDLSWSKSEYLLSSSMDKTVRLWQMSSNSCLKTFSHSDYVTCIQFNPVNDNYFISGSLDEKVRIWSIPDRQIVDWTDLHEMVTAACYNPDGQGAYVGSHKGSCHLYDTSDNKLHLKSLIDLQIKKKKYSSKKITGFQFATGSSTEVLVTSADSRIRVIDGVDLVHKFKGFRNTSSQISASVASTGKHIICASEDSHVYIWRYNPDSQPSNRGSRSVPSTSQYEHFYCKDVTVAIPWPNHPNPQTAAIDKFSRCNSQESNASTGTHNPFVDRVISATWPEEKLLTSSNHSSPRSSVDVNSSNNVKGIVQSRLPWGMVIVTAGRGGQLKVFQNFGFPA